MPQASPQKDFSQSHKEIPVLSSYSGTLPKQYWESWTKKTYKDLIPVKSWVCPKKLLEVATSVGLPTHDPRLLRVLEQLRKGANTGCTGGARKPTSHPNSKSAEEFGVRVADALQGWILDGLCFGPLDEHELPWTDYSVNPILVKLKPNGKARICIDMSAPHDGADSNKGEAAAVNSGINAKEFPTKMSSTRTFCESLMKSGVPSEMCKQDYCQAYKHLAVRQEDHKLQVFKFGGKFFGEVMLTFGCTSSAGIFDDFAKLVKDLAERKSGIDPCMVNQVLDDVVACGSEGDGSVRRFYKAFKDICEYIGVLLADETDPDKAFPATHTGKVLGISYDLKRWVWFLTDDKLVPLLLSLAEVCDNKTVRNGGMMTLNGKLNHYMFLVPGGTWQRGFLLPLQDSRESPSKEFLVTDCARKQAAWWITNLNAARKESKILDPRAHFRMNPVHIFTDAAGGDISKIKNGAGGFCPPSSWFYMPWPKLVRENRENSLGVKFGHKLCSLEGFAALLGLATNPDEVRNNEATIFCDNAGFVGVYSKRHSRCEYAYTVAKALNDIATGLACKLNVVKTRRCSGTGEEAADSLSKGDWEHAWENMPNKNVNPRRIPRVLALWISNQYPDLELGRKTLSEMSKYTKVLHLD